MPGKTNGNGNGMEMEREIARKGKHFDVKK
jgi:hypothetical protein